MIRQKSLCTIKEIVKDKPSISRNPSLKHISMQNSHRKYAVEDGFTKRQLNQKNSKDKKTLNFSKDKTKSKGKVKEEKSTNKTKKSQALKPTAKQDQAALGSMQMKKQLKLLISKNTSKNVSKPSQHSQFVKKIQKCRQNGKKSEKQLKVKTNASLSQRSQQNLKQQKQKEKKMKSPSKVFKQLQPQSLNASKHIESSQSHKYHFGLKNARFSLQTNPIGVQRSQIQQALLNKPKKQQKSQKIQQKNNFLDIFKRYKKSFDIQGLKFQKGLKSSKQKTIQSNNVSQLSLMGKIKSSTSQDIKLNKSQTPSITKQHVINRQVINLNEFNIKQSQSLINQTQQEFVKLKINNKIVKKIDIDIPPQKPNHYFTQHKDSFVQIKQKHQQNNEESNRQIKQGEKVIQFQLYQEQSTVQQKTNEPKSNQDAKNTQQVLFAQIFPLNDRNEAQINNSKFQASKYYVQPIPQFKQKNKGNIQSQSPIINKDYDDNSLLGCQITIIEKNIVIDQQDFNF